MRIWQAGAGGVLPAAAGAQCVQARLCGYFTHPASTQGAIKLNSAKSKVHTASLWAGAADLWVLSPLLLELRRVPVFRIKTSSWPGQS